MDEVCPTFAHFTVHEWKLMKSSQYLTVLPSHFNNIFLKSFRLLRNLSRNCEILQNFPRFHKTNSISWNFSGIILCFHSVTMYFVDFRFCFRYFQKMTAKFQFCSNRFKILKIQNFEVSNLASFKLGDGKKVKKKSICTQVPENRHASNFKIFR